MSEDDYIRRGDVVRGIGELCDTPAGQSTGLTALVYAAKTIEALPAADVVDCPRWIPVTERLPMDRQNVLCYSDVHDVNQAIAVSTKSGMCFVDPIEEYLVFTHVTHWMEMPKPPKEVNS